MNNDKERRRKLRNANHCCTTCGLIGKPSAIKLDAVTGGLKLKEIGKCQKCDTWTTVPGIWLINHIQILIKKVDKLDNRLQVLESNKDDTTYKLEKEEE